jgi:hypothetical protein
MPRWGKETKRVLINSLRITRAGAGRQVQGARYFFLHLSSKHLAGRASNVT